MHFSRTFKALNFDFQIQGLSRTFKVRANPVKRNFKIPIPGQKKIVKISRNKWIASLLLLSIKLKDQMHDV